MIHKYIERILKARVYDVAVETPLDYAANLSKRLDNSVYLKREDMQQVFSFKLRGAYNKIASLTDDEKKAGVIAASAGNHAQGVALAASKLGITAIIVMPCTTPHIKVQAVHNLGGQSILHGDSYDEACEYARTLAEERHLTFVHPYDDPEVIAGQGTIAMEILRQHGGPINAIFVPVGGGGLIAGIAAYVKFLRPETRIIGVEPDDADCLNQAMKAARRVTLKQVGLFADGVAVKQIGRETFKLAQHTVDAVITVSTDEICAAIKDIFEDTRSIAEPAGALALAGLKKYVEENAVARQTLIAIESGANINFDRLRHVAERAQRGEHRELLLAVTIPEQPGSFLKFCRRLDKRSITEFNYRYSDPQQAHVFAGLQVSNTGEDKTALIRGLEDEGFGVTDMTGNELAIEHIRYMVGGHSPHALDEVVYSFEFPERPGALLHFLTLMGTRWNISLFHYRNHGAAFGRVLMAIQVPPRARHEFKSFLHELGYQHREETDNPAYRLFAGRNMSDKSEKELF
ncbi:threonine ammonia-lyase, biosynthetic [Candidatus Methylospira mobilis]|uniref:L-threonine dehydratase n=1 Tax=Candidatus Methylospira mobilis TaxID=1808979 RepID=A0A5Q0BCV8_9GAMM|nr:threonine ammonia-lyase, biosynthetic [Candidatus Methylospira mobilis]QFY41753.1 threonine ammonia-lyase, biosynthetic [Candidatus Methylospira mobilis]WNV06611.1 threonine ammonia-lyase, biosynthetic [Candidatus Methylospira mobilis]